MIVSIRRHNAIFDGWIDLHLIQRKTPPVLLSHKVSNKQILICVIGIHYSPSDVKVKL
jgi:hypothetical protein